MNLGKTITEKRKQLSMTQEDLAARLGVSPQAVSKWENNLSCPDITLLPDIAGIFGITVDELLGVSKAEIADEPAPCEAVPEPEPVFEEAEFSGKKATKLLITREYCGKTTTVKFPLSIVRFGLNLSGIFGGLTGQQASAVDNAIRTGLVGEILSVDGENGEKVTISLA